MKKTLGLICALAMIALLPSLPVLAVCGGLLAFGSLTIAPLAGCADATLILPILTGKVLEAFRSQVPELSFFSTDFGRDGGDFAQPVKWKQEIISHLAQIPDASDYTPGDSLSTGATSAKDLVKDIKVKIDRAKIVRIKVPAGDAATLLVQPAFMQALAESGKTLGRAVVSDALGEISDETFSHELVVPAVNADMDSIADARVQLNKQFAKTPRFILANSDWVRSLSGDPRVLYSNAFGQRITSDPYARYNNIEGFQTIAEYTEMPDLDNLEGFAFEKRAIHVAVRQLVDGLDLAKSLGVPIPILRTSETDMETGVSMTSLMFIDVDTTDLYAAFIVAYGIRAGKEVTDPDDPADVAADEAMDRCGLRLVSAANS